MVSVHCLGLTFYLNRENISVSVLDKVSLVSITEYSHKYVQHHHSPGYTSLWLKSQTVELDSDLILLDNDAAVGQDCLR